MLNRIVGFFSRKASAVGPMIARFALGRPVFPGRNYTTYSKEAYQRNIIAYRCIQLISTAAASVPWLLYREDEEIEEHWALQLLKKPNPMWTGKELFTALYAYDLLSGNGYLERVRVDGGRRVQELWAHRSDRIKIVPGPFGLPSSFVYTVNSTTKNFDVDPVTGESDLLHVKQFNPVDDWYGQSPLEALGMSVDSHNEATAWNYAVLRNGARPSGALQYEGEGEMDDDNFHRLKKEITESYGTGGYDDGAPRRQGRPMLLTGGLKWVQMMLTQMDLDWSRGKEVSAREVAVGYNVPEQLVGVPGQQTYNNYREARMALYEDAVIPLLTRYAEALTNWFSQLPEFEGLRIGFDEDAIPALAPRREALWEKVSNAKFLTIDEKRNALGYGTYEPGEQPGEVIFVGVSDIPLTDVGALSMEETAPQLDAEGNPIVQEETPALTEGALPATAGPVQDLALNGAQIQAVVQIVQNVVDDLLPPESAIQLLLVSFPSIDEATARALIDPAAEFEKPEPPTPIVMPGAPAVGNLPPKPPRPAKTPVEKHIMGIMLKLRKQEERKHVRHLHQLAYGAKSEGPTVTVNTPITFNKDALHVGVGMEPMADSNTEYERDPKSGEIIRSVKTFKRINGG